MAQTNPIQALAYLQTQLAETVNHKNQEETKEVGDRVEQGSKYFFRLWGLFWAKSLKSIIYSPSAILWKASISTLFP